MARSTPVIQFTGVEQLARAMQDHDQKVKRIIAGQFLWAEGEAVTYAKRNAPWTDRTGNARAGLFAKASSIDRGMAFELVMAGSVFYQIFLETRFSGKYAILMPTVNYIGKLMLERIGHALQRLEAQV